MKKPIRISLLILLISFIFFSSLYANPSNDPVGMWTGKIGKMRIAIEIEKNISNELEATFYNLDGRVLPFKANSEILKSDGISLVFPMIRISLSGDFNDTGEKLLLNQKRGKRDIPVTLVRTNTVNEVDRRKSFVLPEGMNPQAPMELADMAFLIGEWHGNHTKPGAKGEFLLVWKGKWILEGRVFKNTSRTWALTPEGKKGQTTQFGMDIRSYNVQTKKWDHTYTNALSGKINKMTWKKIGNEIVSDTTRWMDYEGYNLNIIKFKNISEDHFSWTVDKSFDNGKTWKEEYVVIENYRVK